MALSCNHCMHFLATYDILAERIVAGRLAFGFSYGYGCLIGQPCQFDMSDTTTTICDHIVNMGMGISNLWIVHVQSQVTEVTLGPLEVLAIGVMVKGKVSGNL